LLSISQTTARAGAEEKKSALNKNALKKSTENIVNFTGYFGMGYITI
jgi:hypothetical protein